MFRHREERAPKGLQESLLVLHVAEEQGYTTFLSPHVVAPAGLNFHSALHFHSQICLGPCLSGKIIAHRAGMWINSTSLQGMLQVQWGLVCTRTLLWSQPRCKSLELWHQFPTYSVGACGVCVSPPGPVGLYTPSAHMHLWHMCLSNTKSPGVFANLHHPIPVLLILLGIFILASCLQEYKEVVLFLATEGKLRREDSWNA